MGQWNSAAVQTYSESIRTFVRYASVQYSHGQEVIPARFCAWIDAICGEYTGSSFAKADGQAPICGMLVPPVGNVAKVGVWRIGTGDESTETLPCVLSDIWIAMAVDDLPRGLKPRPPGFKKDGLHGIVAAEGKYRELVIGAGALFSLWLPHEDKEPQMGVDELPVYNDDTFFDRQLAGLLGDAARGVVDVYASGAAVAGSIAAAELVAQKRVTPAFYLAAGTYVFGRVITSNTNWRAECDSNGNRYWPAWNAATAVAQNREMMGVVPGYVETWQMGEAIVPPQLLVGPGVSSRSIDALYGALTKPADFTAALPSTGAAEGAATETK